MLAGLIFAIEEAADRPGTLAATLPFGGMTLLEYQARLLSGAGVTQIFVAVGRMTPALLAAVNRAGKRGTPVEVVRSAEEASEKVDPAARVLVIADGLVTTGPVIDRMAAEGGEPWLIPDDLAPGPAIERLDMKDSWAGIARVTGAQLGEIAQMPADYDFQSALLRVAVQAQAEHVMLTPGWARSGHSVELNAQALASKSNHVLAALTERRTSWADRWVFTRIARFVLPELTTRGVPGWALEAAALVLSLGALAGIGRGWVGTGLGVSLIAVALIACAGAIAALNGKNWRADLLEIGITILFGVAVLAVGAGQYIVWLDWTPVVLALAAVGSQVLVERATKRHRRWWSSPSGLLLLLTPFAIAGFVTAGLAIIATYAFATLAGVVETMREKA